MPTETIPITTDWSRRLKRLLRGQEIGRQQRERDPDHQGEAQHPDFEAPREARDDAGSGFGRGCHQRAPAEASPSASSATRRTMSSRAGNGRPGGMERPIQPRSWPRLLRIGTSSVEIPPADSVDEAGVAPGERLGDRGVGIAGGAAGGEADARPARRGSRPEADQLLVVEERPEGAGAVGLGELAEQPRVALGRGARRGEQRQLLLVSRRVGRSAMEAPSLMTTTRSQMPSSSSKSEEITTTATPASAMSRRIA